MNSFQPKMLMSKNWRKSSRYRLMNNYIIKIVFSIGGRRKKSKGGEGKIFSVGLFQKAEGFGDWGNRVEAPSCWKQGGLSTWRFSFSFIEITHFRHIYTLNSALKTPDDNFNVWAGERQIALKMIKISAYERINENFFATIS